MVALDCEMCETAEGIALTRITVVDRRGQVLMDELVRPEAPITDYVTRYSGITAAMMAGVTTSLADVQERFLALVSAETLLVGHALENDLRVLRCLHGRIVDTAILYPHPKGPPARCALRVLAKRYLQRSIQGGSHDSAVDARTALDLALLKMQHGPAFGLPGSASGERLMDVLAASKRRCTLVDRGDMLSRHLTGTASAVACVDDVAVVARASRELRQPATDFVWAQMRELADVFERRARSKAEAAAAASGDGAAGAAAPLMIRGQTGEVSTSDEAVDGALRRLDAAAATLHAALLPNTLFMVFTGHGDTAETRRQRTEKYRRQAGLDGMPAWGVADEARLTRLCKEASEGLCFAVVKQPTAT